MFGLDRNVPGSLIVIGSLGLMAACDAFESGDGTALSRVVEDQPVDGIEERLAQQLSPGEAEAFVARVADPDTDLSAGDVDELDVIITSIADETFGEDPITPWADIPTTGSANYFGGLELVPNNVTNDRVFGAMTATTDFVSETVTGTVRNFVHIASGDEQPGTLTLDAEFFRNNDLVTAFGIRGQLTGTLSGNVIDGAVDIDVSADFADGGSVIYGGGEGTVGADDVTAAFLVSED